MSNCKKEINNIIANAEEIMREYEANELERLFGYATPCFADYILLDKIYNRINENHKSNHHLGLVGCYLAGFVYGIRAERKRRKDKSKSYTKINKANEGDLMFFQEVKLYE